MEIHIQLNQAIALIGFAWAIVGIILLARKETEQQAKKRYSLALIITFCLPMLESLLEYYASQKHPLRFLNANSMSFLYGPLLFLYAKEILNEPVKGFKKNAVHFIPFFICYASEFIISLSAHSIPGEKPPLQILPVFGAISILVYGLVVYRKIEQYKKTIDDHFSSHEADITLSWLKNLAIGYILLFALSFTALYLLSPGILHFSKKVTHIFSLEVVTNIPLALFILYFLLFGTEQKVIVILQTERSEISPKMPPEGKPNKHSSNISTAEMEKLVAQLKAMMQKSKFYLDSDLTLERLATATGITRHKLSHILKEGVGVAFYSYINRYRIAEFENLVKQGRNKKLSILGLTYECGFKGSSSFYNALKKERNMTPKQLIKKIESAEKLELSNSIVTSVRAR